MCRQLESLKGTTALLLLVALFVSTLEPLRASVACEGRRELESVARSSRPVACCCGLATQPRTCCCQRDADSLPVPLSAIPDQTAAAKWILNCEECSAIAVAAAPARAPSIADRCDSASIGRSIQAILCVWRI